MNLIEKFLELFRKKEFYEIDYDKLNTFSVSFKEVTDGDLEKIKDIIIKFNDAKFIDDKKLNLVKDTALKISNIDDLMEHIKITILKDYRKTYFEATEKKWEFNYFLTNFEPIHKDSLFISCKLSSSVNTSKGDVMYSILALRKVKGYFYFWSLLEDYDGFI